MVAVWSCIKLYCPAWFHMVLEDPEWAHVVPYDRVWSHIVLGPPLTACNTSLPDLNIPSIRTSKTQNGCQGQGVLKMANGFFWHSHQFWLNKLFDLRSHSMRKGCDKENGRRGEKNGENNYCCQSTAWTDTFWNADRSCQLSWYSFEKLLNTLETL